MKVKITNTDHELASRFNEIGLPYAWKSKHPEDMDAFFCNEWVMVTRDLGSNLLFIAFYPPTTSTAVLL